MRRILVIAFVLGFAVPVHATDADTGTPTDQDLPTYTGPEFQDHYRYAIRNTRPNLDLPVGYQAVTGNDTVDERIFNLAVARGYVPQPVASGRLGQAGIVMQPLAAEAWTALNAEARANGMGFIARSAYRSLTTQRIMFNERLTGTSEAAIERALTWAAPPGLSKHHTGYAIDFRYPNGTYGGFRSTPGYAWLAARNFEVAKRYGFIPSYPDDVENQGPNPEPWEFIWVGTDLIRCGIPQNLEVHRTGPMAGILKEIERCPGGAGPATVPEWIDSGS